MDEIKLDERMKQYEHESLKVVKIDEDMGFIIRMDGHKFSTFTKKVFRKPFDPIFIKAMIMTMEDVMIELRPTMGYCHSDEITLYFPPIEKKEGVDMTRDRGGKVFKLLTHSASCCSVRFNYNLNKLISDPTTASYLTPESIELIKSCEQYFDSRVMLLPKENEWEILNYFKFRSVMDSNRNCISTFHRHYYGHSETNHKTSDKMILKMNEDHNFEEKIPLYLRYGIYAKFETYDTIVYVEKLKKEFNAVRKRIKLFSLKIDYDLELMKLFNKIVLEKDDEELLKHKIELLKIEDIDLERIII
jgi:tRNA(His) guanylyltransferase